MTTWTREQVKEFFEAHWTVRKYKDVQIPEQDLEVMMEAAQRAPTDATAQMYSFIRLTSRELRGELAEISQNPHLLSASEAFVICADLNRLERILEGAGYEPASIPHSAIHFAIGDAALAGQNLLLAAELMGYRGCWIGGIMADPQGIATKLDLPEKVFPFAGLTIGKSDESPKRRPRLPRNQVFHENTYKVSSENELHDGVSQMGAITQRGDWASTLNRYFGKGGSMEQREIELRALLEQSFFRQRK